MLRERADLDTLHSMHDNLAMNGESGIGGAGQTRHMWSWGGLRGRLGSRSPAY